MSTLTTPDEAHASRASSSEHSLTATHVDRDTASQSNFRKSLSDVEKSAFSVLGSSSTSLQTDLFYIEFKDNDPRNPVTYSRFKKWCITLVVCGFTGVTATASSSFAMGTESMLRDLHCTQFQATIALCVYPLGFALVPLFTTAFSEEVGRKPIYLVTAFASVLCYALAAMSNTIQMVIVARALGGAFASTGSTLVGGTIADIWEPAERGLPMSLFAIVNMTCTGFGPMVSGWVEYDPRLQWRWIQWLHAIFSGAYFVIAMFTMKETRQSIILRRLAQKRRKETGDPKYRARVEGTQPALRELVWTSCTRPIQVLLTEPIATSISLWVFIMWGVLFCLISSVSPLFKTLYGFNSGQSGMVYTTIVVGAFVGLGANVYQDKLYRQNVARRGPEARLYLTCLAAALFPLAMFMFAWTATQQFHWIWPVIALTIFMFGAFIAYLVVFLYLADCYGPYASSALAGQSLCRNMGSFAFPLFANDMFMDLTYKWSNTLFAGIALVIVPIPFVLFFYGSSLRKRSTLCSKIVTAEQDATSKADTSNVSTTRSSG
ncbi:major facilitator superfamily domain-containing protein [Lanmaoa asiatica]|nr:major facilitator superfamily domain-containing protein [Lanmaoa asiatica]